MILSTKGRHYLTVRVKLFDKPVTHGPANSRMTKIKHSFQGNLITTDFVVCMGEGREEIYEVGDNHTAQFYLALGTELWVSCLLGKHSTD